VKVAISREKEAISPVPATMRKEDISNAKAVTSREKEAISPVRDTIAKETAPTKALHQEEDTRQATHLRATRKEDSVHAPLATILMPSTA